MPRKSARVPRTKAGIRSAGWSTPPKEAIVGQAPERLELRRCAWYRPRADAVHIRINAVQTMSVAGKYGRTLAGSRDLVTRFRSSTLGRESRNACRRPSRRALHFTSGAHRRVYLPQGGCDTWVSGSCIGSAVQPEPGGPLELACPLFVSERCARLRGAGSTSVQPLLHCHEQGRPECSAPYPTVGSTRLRTRMARTVVDSSHSS